ncbi:hypothetical protein BABINDRAFT_159443 [Babjeviella inositovora NRRL Y-12698]|uniref:C2H2-type domain-containing protein n=1 Tax=Babjeviella inositovora NRRL Y-12698 TaxID=984486 RepID=A0A1E3QZI9_9ASCO|nr:uncharacterized protein BABINDRAFT_159443 [Babjeviella inositovora NRRL Y-12698]ODQ82964.1 hypothetical protein BABINDRAFT_159443 [Babjeviella inositovora NRRL Y-12698]
MTSNPFWYTGPMRDDDLDPYLASDGYNEIDQILTQTLNSLDDLDIPSAGYAEPTHDKKHSRKISGTAIFGFHNHNREFSINLLYPNAFKASKLDMPREMLMPNDFFLNKNETPAASPPHTPTKPHKIDQQLLAKPQAASDYIIKTEKPSGYKFPASPPPPSMHQYSVEYLNRLAQYQKSPEQRDVGDETLTYNATNDINFEPSSSPFVNPQPRYQTRGFVGDYSMRQNNLPQFPTPFRNPVADFSPLNHQGSYDPHATPTKPHQHYTFDPYNQPRSPQRFHQNPYITSEPDFLNPNFSDQRSLQDIYSSPTRNFDQEPIPFHPIPALSHSGNSEISSLSSSPYRLPQEPFPSSPIAGYGEPYPSLQLPLPVPATPVKKTPITWDEVVVNDDTPNTLDRISRPTPSPKRKSEPVSTLEFGLIDTYIEGPNEDKLYICTFHGCGKTGPRRYNIRSHVQTHLSDRPYKCDKCTKDFVRQHDLIRHYRIHQEGSLGCECGKKFTRNDALRRHKQRNVCVGGIPDPSGIIKPKKKRGRPKKIDPSQESQIDSDILGSDIVNWSG